MIIDILDKDVISTHFTQFKQQMMIQTCSILRNTLINNHLNFLVSSINKQQQSTLQFMTPTHLITGMFQRIS